METINPRLESLVAAGLLQSEIAIAAVLPRYLQVDPQNEAKLFVGEEDRWIVHRIVRYLALHEAQGRPPSKTWLLNQFRRDCEARFPSDPLEPERAAQMQETRQNMRERFDAAIERRLSMAVEIREVGIYFTELIETFRLRATQKMLLRAMENFTAAPDLSVLDFLNKEATEIARIGEESPVVLSEFFTDLEQDFAAIRKKRDHPEEFLVYPSGIDLLDKTLGGGLSPGEMGMVIAAPGKGKSSILRDIVVAAAFGGAHCLIVSLEQHVSLARRQLLSRITGVAYDVIKEGRLEDAEIDEKLGNALKACQGRMAGSISILDLAEGSSVGAVRGLIDNSFRKRFDLYAWDHMGLMEPSVKGSGDRMEWRSQAMIADEIRRFSRSQINARGARGVVSWVACQEKPGTGKRGIDTIESTDIALASHAAWPGHAIVFLIRTDTMKRESEAILKITKVRDGADSLLVKVRTDLTHCHFLAEQTEIRAEEVEEPKKDPGDLF